MSEPHGTMAGGSAFDALVEKVLAGTAPEATRSAAARGALPLPRPLLVRLYVHLRDDANEGIRADARRSLETISGDVLAEVLADPGCPAAVLAHFASQAARDEHLAETVAFHRNVGDDALATLAGEGNAQVIDLVLTNQERLLSSPALFDRLSANPALRADQRGRILDVLEQFFKDKTEAIAPDPSGGDAALGDARFEEAARLLEVDVGELFAASEIADGEEFAESESVVVRGAYQRILTMNTAQKAILAMKGGREERMILVRDTNKVVALSVLKNGRLTELEIEAIARMRNVSDEVLRQIGGNREWAKAYPVTLALVHNPRTPPGVSTNFVTRLTIKDLKMLVKDKNVPEIIRKMAKRTFDTRTQKSSPAFRKK